MITRLTIILTILFAPLATSLAQESWVLYLDSKAERHMLKKFYYDSNSIKEVEPNVYEVQHKNSSGDDNLIYNISQYWVDCTRRKMAVGQWTNYMRAEVFQSGNLFKKGFYEPRGPIEGVTTEPYDPEWQLIRIICNR